MSALRRVLSTIAFFLFRDTNFIQGEFTGANGSVGTILFKGVATVSRSGEGVYIFKLLQADGSTALLGFKLKSLSMIGVAPAAADGLSGVTEITTDALNASGTVTFTTRNLAGTAADVIGRCIVSCVISPEAAS